MTVTEGRGRLAVTMDFLNRLFALVRQNPLILWVAFAVTMGFVILMLALWSTL